MPDKFIDVERIIASKNPRLLKWMPGFILRYLKRIIHEKEINEFLEEHKEKKNLEFCKEVVKYFNIKVEVEGLERIPKNGKITISMNHPLGGMDAMILVTALEGHREDLKFIVNDILMNLDNLKDLFVGVNKVGKSKAKSHGRVLDLFKSDQAVCVFPAGLVSRKIKGQVQDLEWKKTFVTNARKNERLIVPVFIEGRLSNFFYRLSNWRKFFGIKANIEMLYLSNELFKQHNRTIRFKVGEAIDIGSINENKKDKEIAVDIREKVYSLR